MANLVQRAAARVFGLATSDTVAQLRGEVEGLQKRVKMRAPGSGVEINWGEFSYEYIEGLRGDDRWDVYDKMESDPLIKEGLDSFVLPLCTGKWEIQPASDKAIDKEIAEFVAANLLRKASDRFGREYFIQTSWTGQRLVEILDFLKCGFAMFAKSTRSVDGKKIVYDQLQWLEPRSVDPRGWKLDETDKIVEVKRTYRTPEGSYELQKPVPAEQLVLYPWDFKGARYEGRPKIRSLYGAFIRKDAMVRYAVIWAQKAGAPMPVGHYPAGFTEAQKVEFEKIVRGMRGQSTAEAFGVLPLDSDGTAAILTYAGLSDGTAQVDRMRSLINGENSEIAHGSNTKSRLLGETASGSRATGETQSEDEDVSVDAVVARICEIESDGIANLPGVIQELADWNYPNVKEYPRLFCSRVGPREDFRTLDPMIKMWTAGIIPRVPAVRKQLTEKIGMKLPDEDYEIQEPVVDAMGNPVPPSSNPKGTVPASGRSKQLKTAPGGNGGGGAQTDADDEKQARQLTMRFGLEALLQLPEGDLPVARAASSYGRTPTAFESKVCMLGMVSASLQAGGDHISSALRRARAQMIEDLLRRIESGAVSRRTLGTLRRSRPEGYGTMVAAVRERFLDVAREGRQHAREELARQKEFARELASRSLSLSEIRLGRKKPTEPEETNMLPAGSSIPVAAEIAQVIADLAESGRAISILTSELAGEAKVATQIAVDEIWNRALAELITNYNRAIRSGLTEAQALKEVERALQGLSTAQLDMVGRQVAEVAYNQGRDFAAKEAAVEDEAQWALRSEVLDSRTCQSCASLDGIMVKIGTPEYEQLMPPARCQGGDNCRGFYVVISKELAEQMAAKKSEAA